MHPDESVRLAKTKSRTAWYPLDSALATIDVDAAVPQPDGELPLPVHERVGGVPGDQAPRRKERK
jgi:hypothetical protein